jgi:probable HAF family extracellular repeat protein
MPHPAAAAIRYNVTDLGTLPGYESSRAWSINNKGQVIGWAESDSSYLMKAVLFDATGAGNNIDLGTLGGENSYAHSINIKGQIVGAAYAPHYNWNATIFDANGEGNNIKLAIKSWALSINDNGRIVGGGVNSFGYERAILFDPNDANNNIELGPLDGFNHSNAHSINNCGQIVGFALNNFIILDYRATLFDPSGQGNNIDLGTLGGEHSAAMSINDYGRIVGHADIATGACHAVLFEPNGTGNNVDLGTLDGCNYLVAASINNKGQIVGLASKDASSGFRAVMFDPTGNGDNLDLNDLIDPTLGYSLNTAICINDNGWIVGRGTRPGKGSLAFLLKPAMPGDSEPDRDVDLKDYAVFTAAWRSTPADNNWNPFCDISEPEDGSIDESDLAVFADNYLMQSP